MEERITEFLRINYGDGSGSSEGYGDGSGSGSSSGYGYGLISFNKESVYYVDGVPTIFKSIKKNVAKGLIVNKDLTTTPCYIVKSGNYFAHGETIKKAMADVEKKRLDNMPVEEKIDNFVKKFKSDKAYSGHEFYEWHGTLTGSCEMGRNSFISNNGIDLDKKYTVLEFVKLVKNQYGSSVIAQLKQKYEVSKETNQWAIPIKIFAKKLKN